jgi:hypothetical protein
MKGDLNSQLKSGVAFAGFVIWTVLLGVGIWVNGGLGPITSPLALALAALALLGSAIFFLLIMYSPTVRAFALRPGADLDTIRKELWFTILLTGFLGAGTLYSLFAATWDA